MRFVCLLFVLCFLLVFVFDCDLEMFMCLLLL